MVQTFSSFFLPEGRVNASLLTFCHPCYCHPCYQPKVTGMTRSNRVDTHTQITALLFSSLIKVFVFKNNTAISVPEYNFHVTKENTFFFYPCYHLSSLLLLVGNRDDSNRDDKKYANSHLLCFLEAKT